MSIVTQIVCVVGFGDGSHLSCARKVRRDAPYGWGRGLTQRRKARKGGTGMNEFLNDGGS
tara:strand:+ start:226 stop:405 length:180 start_codon:yes stop_codon:yes gene_type:complete